MRSMRLILNGKGAASLIVREAVNRIRREGQELQIRVTWEAGDAARYAHEAKGEGIDVLVAGGGDGTINEVVNGLFQTEPSPNTALSVLPLGTANDFATGCTLPNEPYEALKLAAEGNTQSIDIGKANDRFFINVASGGFGAQVTSSTPVALKNFLGGGAYTITGLLQAASFTPYQGELRVPKQNMKNEVIIGAVCNGRQAGGGQRLAPHALINDGLLDIVGLYSFPRDALAQVVNELADPNASGKYVKRFRVPWAEWESDVEMPINLDGEPIKAKRIRFEVLPGAIQLVLPDNCPMFKI